MTCLISSNNSQYSVLTADTWNTTPSNNKYIQKIIVNETNKIAIGTAGDNSIKFNNNQIIYLKDILSKILNDFNGHNINSIKDTLFDEIKKFLSAITLDKNKNEASVQGILLYYNSSEFKKDVFTFDIVKKLTFPSLNNIEWFGHIDNNKNINCTSFGTYSNKFNTRNINQSFENYSPNEMIEWTKEQVNMQIENDRKLEVYQRGVGDKIHWCSMDKKGNISTNICKNYIVKEAPYDDEYKNIFMEVKYWTKHCDYYFHKIIIKKLYGLYVTDLKGNQKLIGGCAVTSCGYIANFQISILYKHSPYNEKISLSKFFLTSVQQQYNHMRLKVNRNNTAAIKLYEKCGFIKQKKLFNLSNYKYKWKIIK